MSIQDSSHRREQRARPATRRQPALRRGVAAVALWLVTTAGLSAAPLTLTALPSRLELSDATPSVAMTVHNDSKAAVIVRLQPMVWVSDPVIDHFEPTADVKSTPRVFALEPGATQQVRVDLIRSAGVESASKYQLSWQAVAAAAGPQS